MIYRVTAWCMECGQDNLLAQPYPAGAVIYLVCIRCETPITVTVEIPEPAKVTHG